MLETFSISIEERIASAINSFREQSDKNSLRYLESKSGVNKNYIDRLSKQEIPAIKMDIGKVYLVLKTMVGDKVTKDVIFSDETLKEKFLSFTWISEKNAKDSTYIGDLENLLSKHDNAIVFTLAANHCGTTLKEIRDILGTKGLLAVETLVDKGLVILENNKVKASPELTDNNSKAFFTFSRDMYKTLIPIWTQHYQPHRAGKQRNYIAGVTGSFNREFIKELFNKMDEFKRWVSDETKKAQNQGDIPYFVTMAMDSFVEEIENKGVLQ